MKNPILLIAIGFVIGAMVQKKKPNLIADMASKTYCKLRHPDLYE